MMQGMIAAGENPEAARMAIVLVMGFTLGIVAIVIGSRNRK